MRIVNIISLFAVVLSHYCSAQLSFVRFDSIPVKISGDTLSNAWAGGLNSPQFSQIDLDGDGVKDLFVFERLGGKTKTYINIGTPNEVDYKYSPEFQWRFPKMQNWTLLADYNCDGKEDIFTQSKNGIAVYRNDYNSINGLRFTLITSLIYTNDINGPVSLYVGPSDLPAITDIDNDGDIDILTFSVSGSTVEYHKNMSIEKYGSCDSLDFEVRNKCWGYFSENALNNGVTLFDTCTGNVSNPESAHGGSTLLALELFGNGVKDLVLGDVSFNNLVMLKNGGTATSSSMITVDTAFPSTSTSVDLSVFPAGYYLDLNNDGKKDLLVSPNSPFSSENFKSVWYYKNTGLTTAPTFTYQKNNFLQEEMIEVGSGANPTFFDYNADGLLDIIIGNFGYFDGVGNYLGQLSLYENIGTKTNPSYELVTRDYAGLLIYSLNGLSPTFGDLDFDGDEDMMLGLDDGKLHYFENTAGIGSPANFVLNQANYKGIDIGQFSSPQLIDVNRDGTLDLLVGESDGTLNYFENIGNKVSADFNSIPTIDFFGGIDVMIQCCTGYSTPFMVEDSTGNYILFVGSEKGYLYQYDNIDGNLTGNFNVVDSLYLFGMNISVSGAEINNDNNLELIYGEWYGGVAILKDGIQTSIGINSFSNKTPDFLVYPNPSNGKINIEVINSSLMPESMRVEIYNVHRKQIFSIQIESGNRRKIDLSNNLPGIYFVRITGINGNSTVKKLVLF